MSLRLIIIFAFSYFTTSFQVSNNRSVSIAKSISSSDSLPQTSENQYKKLAINLLQDIDYHIDLGQDFTAIKITSSDSSAAELSLFCDSDSIYFGTIYTNDVVEMPPSFSVFSSTTRYITLRSNKSTSIVVELFYAKPIQIKLPKSLKNKTNCEKPTTVPQSEWRQGLPVPKPGRNTTIVKHCIIHHSAGSNTNTDYLNTIRNIYLLHTQSNGWDDIGYNFVIAPDGTIFSGRDPQNEGDEDNIQGAHFCAKNGGTMGICLLGNYNLTSPKPAMQNSLEELLAWKLHKENISTEQRFAHPDALGQELGTISMHRSGCPTECPGDSLALVLSQISANAQEIIDQCNNVVSMAQPTEKYKQLIYPNPSSGRFYVMIEEKAAISSYTIRGIDGKSLEKGIFPANGLIKTALPSGIYSIVLLSKELPISTQKISIKRD